MKARRLDNGVVWDLSPEYLNRYKVEFEVLVEQAPAKVEVDRTEVEVSAVVVGEASKPKPKTQRKPAVKPGPKKRIIK